MDQGTKKKKPDQAVLKDLWSADDKLVLQTIHKLRTTGNLTYVPDLLRLLGQAPSEPVEKELVRFLADIKDPLVIPMIVNGLQNAEEKPSLAGILSAIWQSGLDYSKYIDLFIQLFLDGNYLVALESFTVIEQSIEHLSDEEMTDNRNRLLAGLDRVSEDKKPLARELVNLLQA
jgi:hypothetical protein